MRNHRYKPDHKEVPGSESIIENHRSIGKSMSIIHRHGRAFVSNRLKEYNIGSGQFPYFRMLLHRNGQSQEELSRFFHVNKATVGRAVRKLMEEGYVERRRNPEDRRAYQVFLTEKGEHVGTFVIDILRELTEVLTSDFTAEEFKLFLDLLNRMHRNILDSKYAVLDELEGGCPHA